MAGKFTNTKIMDTTNSIVEGVKNRFTNNMYRWNGTMVTVVDYLNIDKEHSTFDEGSGLTYRGYSGSFKFNLIKNFIISGLEKVLVNYDFSDEGVTGYDITGDAVVLAGTGIVPYVGDHFSIQYVNESKRLLFRVEEVQDDTLSNGGNSKKITYRLITTDPNTVAGYYENIINTYEFVESNVGTEKTPIVSTKSFSIIKDIEKILDIMRDYYIGMFYSPYVQCLVFNNGIIPGYIYDSYLTHFIATTGIMSTPDKYIHFGQQISLKPTFNIKYNKSFFTALIELDKTRLAKVDSSCYATIIDSKINIFSTRYESYYNMVYEKPLEADGIIESFKFEPFSSTLIENITSNTSTDNILENIMIKYFNGEGLSEDTISSLYDFDEIDETMLFYYVPVVMYILEYYAKKLMSK